MPQGNKANQGPLSPRQAGSSDPAASGFRPVSARFSDQLVAVLPRLRRFARGLTGSAVEVRLHAFGTAGTNVAVIGPEHVWLVQPPATPPAVVWSAQLSATSPFDLCNLDA